MMKHDEKLFHLEGLIRETHPSAFYIDIYTD